MSNNNSSNSVFKRVWKSIKRGYNTTMDDTTPYIIVSNFKETSEKECGKIDAKNEKKYRYLLSRASKAEKTVQNSGLHVNVEVPPPPHPSNRDRFILWKKRNSVKHVIPQSNAIAYLTKKGYTLDKDYEAYQAIDLATEIKKRDGTLEQTEDTTIYFRNVYTNRDKNIFRRRSMYKSGSRNKKESVSTATSSSSLESLENSAYLRNRSNSNTKTKSISTSPIPQVQRPANSTQVFQTIQPSAPPPLPLPLPEENFKFKNTLTC